MGERRIDFQGFTRDLLTLLGIEVLEGAHVVEAVGELDDDDADVADHGEEHLADIFGLVVFAIGKLDLVEFGDAFNDVGDLFAEALLDLFGGDVGILYRVVQQAGGDGGGVHFEISEDQADLQRVDDVGFARGALLPFVLLQTEMPCLANDFEIVGGPVFVDFLEKAGELGVEFMDQRRGGTGEMAGRTLFHADRHWDRFGRRFDTRLDGLRAETLQRRNRRQSCFQLDACIRGDGLRTRPLDDRGCGLPEIPGGRWSDCHGSL
jgi:hypothetical protein